MTEPYRIPDPPPPDPPKPAEAPKPIDHFALARKYSQRAMVFAVVALVLSVFNVALRFYLYWTEHHPK